MSETRQGERPGGVGPVVKGLLAVLGLGAGVALVMLVQSRDELSRVRGELAEQAKKAEAARAGDRAALERERQVSAGLLALLRQREAERLLERSPEAAAEPRYPENAVLSDPAETLLRRAMGAYARQKYRQAMNLADYIASRARSFNATRAAAMVMGSAACTLGEKKTAARAHSLLHPAGQKQLAAVCTREGVDLAQAVALWQGERPLPELSPPLLRAYFVPLEVDAARCFDKHGQKGRLSLRGEVTPRGELTEVTLEGSLAKTPTARCVAEAAARLSFPPHAGPAQAVYHPLVLQ